MSAESGTPPGTPSVTGTSFTGCAHSRSRSPKVAPAVLRFGSHSNIVTRISARCGTSVGAGVGVTSPWASSPMKYQSQRMLCCSPSEKRAMPPSIVASICSLVAGSEQYSSTRPKSCGGPPARVYSPAGREVKFTTPGPGVVSTTVLAVSSVAAPESVNGMSPTPLPWQSLKRSEPW